MIDVAGRAEHYTDFGNTATGHIAMHYEPVKGYALRGSLSSGFRAPSLRQEYFFTTSTNFIAVNRAAMPFDIRTFPVTSPEAKAFGARPLDAEKSLNNGIGMAIEPVSNLPFTADYYRIDTHVTRIDPTPPELAAHQQVLFDRTQVGLTEVAQPHDKLRLSADYEVKRLVGL